MTDSYGATPFFNSALVATKVVVRAAGCRVFFIEVINNDLTDIYLQMFDALTANVTVGTTVPTLSLFIPGGTGASNRGGFIETFAVPIAFRTGLVIAATTTATGSGAPTACVVNMAVL